LKEFEEIGQTLEIGRILRIGKIEGGKWQAARKGEVRVGEIGA
jgi:hypothetical protein